MPLPAEVAPAADDAPVDLQAEQQEDAADMGAEDLHDAGDNVPEAADPGIGVTKCAHCKKPLLSTDLPRKKYGRLYHRKNCVNHAKPIAIAA